MYTTMLEAIQAVSAGKTTVEALAKEKLLRLEKENPRVNAVVECRPETVLEQARRIDGRVRAGTAGRLAGAVITVKDNLEVAGLHATAGLARFKDNLAEKDCNAVAKLRAADALILGKTNLPPGAMDAQTDNPVYGRSSHPLFPDRTCGGSSGGGACAVRLGLCHADLGNDLMGSIRIPAHFCGVYGFVPTGSAVFLDGLIGGKAPGSTLSQMLRPGLITRDPRDTRLLLSLLLEPRFPLREAPLPRRLKIAWSLSCGGLPLSEDSRTGLEAFLKGLEADNDLYELRSADYPFALARESFLRLLYGAMATRIPPAALFVARNLMGNRLLDGRLKPYLKAEEDRETCKRALQGLMERFDCLLTPVTATPAFPHIKPKKYANAQPVYGGFDVDGRKVSYAAANLGYTTPFFTANPALSLPAGQTREGLPLGIQAVCAAHDDLKLLDVAQRLAAYACQAHGNSC